MNTLGGYYRENHHDTTLPYPNAGELTERLMAAAPDRGTADKISQLFHATSYYDFRAQYANALPGDNNQYDLHAYFSASEYLYQQGKDMPSNYDGPARVRVLGGENGDDVIYENELLFHKGQAQLQLTLSQKPAQVIVNPDRKLLERSPNDNRVKVL